MVLQELEGELSQIEAQKAQLARIEELERQSMRIDSELTFQQHLLKSLQPKDGKRETPKELAQREAARAEAKRRVDELKAQAKAAIAELGRLEVDVDRVFNPYWGPIFREGVENSRFAEQVEQYACVYTSRVSNFLAYSPLRHFRAPRAHMPHERV
jgi:5'-nucleotidase